MPGERQPTLPALETVVPPKLLDPATRAVAPDATPAERKQASDAYSDPTTEAAPQTVPPAPVTTAPAVTPPPTPPPPDPEPEPESTVP
jgi:DNA polymerase-3 subunit gamma/tau